MNRTTAEIVADMRAVNSDPDVMYARRIEGADRLTELNELLGNIWLYVDWRYLTKQMTTPQKELWADAVDAFGEPGPKVDRWWREYGIVLGESTAP